jgi:hypothetical protein
MTYAFIKHVWSQEDADWCIDRMEYIPHPQDFDPYTERYKISSKYQLPVKQT